MHITGLIMIAFFVYLYFVLYRHLSKSLHNDNFSAAAKTMSKMRPVMAINLSLGIFITFIGIAGSAF
jgi:hypothetical protein